MVRRLTPTSSHAFMIDMVLRSIIIPRGFAPRTPLHANSLAAAPARSDSRGSVAALPRDDRGFAPRTPLHANSLAAAPARSGSRVPRCRSFAPLFGNCYRKGRDAAVGWLPHSFVDRGWPGCQNTAAPLNG